MKVNRINNLLSLKKVLTSSTTQNSPTISDKKLRTFSPDAFNNSFKLNAYNFKPDSRGSPVVMSTNQSLCVEKHSNSPARSSTNFDRNKKILSRSGIYMSDVSSPLPPKPRQSIPITYAQESTKKRPDVIKISSFIDKEGYRPSFFGFEDKLPNSPTSKNQTPDRRRKGSINRSYFPTKTQTSYETGQSFEKINQESDNPARRAKRISIANSQVINKAVGSALLSPLKAKVDKILREVERSVSPHHNLDEPIASVKFRSRLLPKHLPIDGRKKSIKLGFKSFEHITDASVSDLPMTEISKKLENYRHEISSELVKLEKIRPPVTLKHDNSSQYYSSFKTSPGPMKVWKTHDSPKQIQSSRKQELKTKFVKAINQILRKVALTNIRIEHLMRDQPFRASAYERKDSKTFFEHVRIGDVKTMQLFLAQCPHHVYDFDTLKQTALHWAAKRGFSLIVKILIEHNADPDARDLSGRTPLFLAARGGSLDCVKLLLNAGANPMLKSNANKLPVDSAGNIFMRNLLKKAYKIHVILGMYSHIKSKAIWEATDRRDFNVKDQDLVPK